VNLITVHDGFTLRDLVTYDRKHNQANGEGNRDGTDDNRSWNCGVEGPTDDPVIRTLRARQQRNFLTTLLLAQGVPMLLGGDEIGRTQWGNNNAYCQDNEISWFDWDAVDGWLLAFTRGLIALRRDHPVLRRRRWFQGRPIRGTPDIGWCRTDGLEMNDEDWEAGFVRTVGLFLNGEAMATRDRRGLPEVDDSFLLLFNTHHEEIDWTLPKMWGDSWDVVIDTAQTDPEAELPADVTSVTTVARSVIVLRKRPTREPKRNGGPPLLAGPPALPRPR
jgi:glycogen operon protein